MKPNGSEWGMYAVNGEPSACKEFFIFLGKREFFTYMVRGYVSKVFKRNYPGKKSERDRADNYFIVLSAQKRLDILF